MEYENLVGLLKARTDAHPERPFLRYYRDESWQDWSYAIVLRRVEAIAGGLAALGIRSGERVAIIAGARPEWLLADLGSMAAGAIVAGVDPRLSPHETACTLDHAEVRVAFVEGPNHAARLAEFRHTMPHLEHLVLLEGEAPDGAGLLSLAALEALAEPDQGADLLARQARRPREAPAAICYTSGTTGVPRGAVLTHGQLLGALEAAAHAFGDEHAEVDVWLDAAPPSHALGRVCGQFAPLLLGRTLAFARRGDTLVDDAAEVRPHAIVAAPHVLARMIERVPTRPIRERLGDRLSFVFCGGAPVPTDVEHAFEAEGVHVCAGWGLAETAGPVTLNRPGATRPGSIGRPLPGIEVRVGEDGELLVHGPNVFSGYLRDPEGTEDAFDRNGFLRTGDIGHIDDDGFVHLTGRRKEMIVTTDGRSVAPQKLEQMLRERPFIASAMAYGHQRPFVVALITLDRDALISWHPELSDRPLDDPALHTLVEDEVRRVNDRLAQFERIRAFRLLEGEPADPEPLPRRARRRRAEARHQKLLEAMYAAEQVASRPS